MEGPRVTQNGDTRITEASTFRITEEYIRVWALTPNSVSLGVTTTSPEVAFDIAVLSATANLVTSSTSSAVMVDVDVDIVSATVALSTTSANTVVIVDIDVEVTSIPPALALASSDSSVVVEIDVEIIATSDTLGITPTTTIIRFGPIQVTEGYIMTIPVLDRAITIKKTDRNMEYYTKRKSL